MKSATHRLTPGFPILILACLALFACSGEPGQAWEAFRSPPTPAAWDEHAAGDPNAAGTILSPGPAHEPALLGCDDRRCRVRALSPELAAQLAENPDRIVAFEPDSTPADVATLRLFPGVRRLELSHVQAPDLTRVPGKELVELRLGRTGLSDLAPLRAFARLTHLVLFEAPFTDAAPLGQLTELRSLDLSRCPNVRDFAFLSQLTRLESLLLSGTAFSDASRLTGLTGLRELGLGHTRLEGGALTALAGLTALQGLHLDGLAGLTDLAALAGLTALRHLGLSGTGVRDLAPLAGLAELRSLKLNGTPVSKLAPLKQATWLHSLFLQDTRVSDLGPLRGLSQLRWLHLARTPVASLAPLAGLGLTTLEVAGTRVRSLSPLRECRQLERLFLAGTAVSDLGPLSGLPLQFLDLSRTKVVSVAPLAGVPTLVSLSLAHTAVRDLAALAGLGSLEALDLTGVKLDRPAQLEALPALKKILVPAGGLPPDVRERLEKRGVELLLVP
jgi:Leucine-rich repeat (LRR) protein